LGEDGVDDGGLLGGFGAEVAGAGLDGGVVQRGLDLGDTGPSLAEPGPAGAALDVRAKTG
jgi:hypothetical protein